MNIIEYLSGKKTYLTGGLALALLFGHWQGWWNIPQQVYEALMAMALIFLRAGVSKGPGAPTTTAQPASKSPGVPVAAAAALLCGIGLFAGGCSTTPQQVAYRTTGTTIVSVDAAMKEWGAYVATAHPPASQEAAVKNAYEKYQAAMATACDAGAIYASTSSTNAPAASAALNQAIANAGQELADLERLITSFGVKLN